MPWSTRLKRHGGMAFIQAKRARQMLLLSKEKDQDNEIVRGCVVFLSENPNRVLGKDVEAHFGWKQLE